MTRLINRTAVAIAALDLGAVVVYVFAIRWLIPHGGHWSGGLLVLGLIAVAALLIQSKILRARSKEK
jgi:hypothetical protein